MKKCIHCNLGLSVFVNLLRKRREIAGNTLKRPDAVLFGRLNDPYTCGCALFSCCSFVGCYVHFSTCCVCVPFLDLNVTRGLPQ